MKKTLLLHIRIIQAGQIIFDVVRQIPDNVSSCTKSAEKLRHEGNIISCLGNKSKLSHILQICTERYIASRHNPITRKLLIFLHIKLLLKISTQT
jgi:hypothetical protein